MTNLTSEQVKEKLIEMGGNEWNEKGFNRVYISQDIFNAVTGFGFSLNETKNKFYFDVEAGQLFTRKDGKKPAKRATLSDIEL